MVKKSAKKLFLHTIYTQILIFLYMRVLTTINQNYYVLTIYRMVNRIIVIKYRKI